MAETTGTTGTAGTTSESKGAAASAWRAFLVTLAILAALGLVVFFVCRHVFVEQEKEAANTAAALDGVTSAAKAGARRVEAIVDAAKEREARTLEKTRARVHDVPADGLPDLLLDLLREWREEQARGGKKR